MAKQFHGGGKSAMGAKKQQKSDVNAAFHPHLQKERAEPTQTAHCKKKKKKAIKKTVFSLGWDPYPGLEYTSFSNTTDE